MKSFSVLLPPLNNYFSYSKISVIDSLPCHCNALLISFIFFASLVVSEMLLYNNLHTLQYVGAYHVRVKECYRFSIAAIHVNHIWKMSSKVVPSSIFHKIGFLQKFFSEVWHEPCNLYARFIVLILANLSLWWIFKFLLHIITLTSYGIFFEKLICCNIYTYTAYIMFSWSNLSGLLELNTLCWKSGLKVIFKMKAHLLLFFHFQG